LDYKRESVLVRLDGCLGLEVECEGSQLYCPLGNAPGSIPIVEDIHQWEIRDPQDIVCIKVVVKLPGSDEYTIKYFLNRWVMNLRFKEDFADEVNWSLHPKAWPSSCRSTTIAVLTT
jgi:hypothetical protein